MEKEIIPETLEEAIIELNKILKEEDKEYIVENGSISVHHSLGRWIRNNWGLWGDNVELKSNLRELGCYYPDDMSDYIIKQYIEYYKNDNK